MTQAWLYFKYLLLWLVPNPGWMSIALEEEFARQILGWPQTLGIFGLAIYGVVAVRLFLKGGRRALLGFALLGPLLLFLVEFSTVRIQEIFVLYRSYLWMPCLAAALPFVVGRLPARVAAAGLLLAAIGLAAVTIERLKVFDDPVRLWDDAIVKAAGSPNRANLGRLYYQRGRSKVIEGQFAEGLPDLTLAIGLHPRLVASHYFRGVAFFETGQFASALADFDQMTRMMPNHRRAQLGRAKSLEALGYQAEARDAYLATCRMGVPAACDRSSGPGRID